MYQKILEKGPLMKKLGLYVSLFIILLLAACGQGTRTIVIESKGNEMKYATTTFEVKANESIRLVMDNKATIEVMKHNIVILTDNEAIDAVGQAAISAKDYLPDHPAILAATPIADAGTQTEVTFTAPAEPGTYAFICTFPGHYMMMQGQMIVK